MIRSVLNYVAVVWTNCENDLLAKVLKLQKRAARLIMDAYSKASYVRLFHDLSWLPFYEDVKISKFLIAFERLRGELPAYITRLLTRNGDLHSRNTRYTNYNLVCSKFKRKSDGGKTFNVITRQLWNSLPTTLQQKTSVKNFKKALRQFFSETNRV